MKKLSWYLVLPILILVVGGMTIFVNKQPRQLKGTADIQRSLLTDEVSTPCESKDAFVISVENKYPDANTVTANVRIEFLTGDASNPDNYGAVIGKLELNKDSKVSINIPLQYQKKPGKAGDCSHPQFAIEDASEPAALFRGSKTPPAPLQVSR